MIAKSYELCQLHMSQIDTWMPNASDGRKQAHTSCTVIIQATCDVYGLPAHSRCRQPRCCCVQRLSLAQTAGVLSARTPGL